MQQVRIRRALMLSAPSPFVGFAQQLIMRYQDTSTGSLTIQRDVVVPSNNHAANVRATVKFFRIGVLCDTCHAVLLYACRHSTSWGCSCYQSPHKALDASRSSGSLLQVLQTCPRDIVSHNVRPALFHALQGFVILWSTLKKLQRDCTIKLYTVPRETSPRSTEEPPVLTGVQVFIA